MEKNVFDFNSFNNCLRIFVQPNHFEDEQIAEIVSFCKKYQFKNVMLFINAEEFNWGHIIKEESAPFLAVMKKAKKIFHENGISFGLNPWMEIGHLDRGRTLKEGQNFTTMVDMNGIRSELVACPLDEEWRKYYFDILTYYLQEVEPDMYWIEDDFRLHNHAPLEFGGCFCEHHVRAMNEKLGKQYTREELVTRIFAKGECTPERKAWLDVSRETMSGLSAEIARVINESGYKGYLGLMSSRPEMHAMEARDWNAIQNNFGVNGKRINRIHYTVYQELGAKETLYYFNSTALFVRSFIPDDTYILPELENGAFSTFVKEPEFIRFQLEHSLPLLISGMTYDIYSFVANGVIEGFGYGEEIAKITPYLDGVRKLNISFSTLEGVILPAREDSVYHQTLSSGWRDLIPKEFNVGGYLGAFGINYKPSSDKRLKRKVVYLTEGSARYFSAEELRDLAENNSIILDGAGAKYIFEKGLGGLFGVENVEVIPSTSGVKSYEQIDNDLEVFGIKNYRVTAQEKVGDYYRITYSRQVEEVSNLYNCFGEIVGHGMVKIGNCFVIPYDTSYVMQSKSADGWWGDWTTKMELFSDIRRLALQRFLLETDTDTPFVFGDYAGVSSYFYQKENGVAIFVNGTLHHFNEWKIRIKNIHFKNVYIIDRKDGNKKRVEYTLNGNELTIREPFLPLASKTVVFE